MTLTLPGAGAYTDSQIKRFWTSLWKRMRRGWWQADKRGLAVRVSAESAAAIWRLEYQERGAPHIHAIIFGLRYIDRLWLSRAWFDCVGSNQADHLKSGTNIERPDYWNDAGGYVAKYIAKQAVPNRLTPLDAGDAEWSWDALHNPGRVWGVLGRANLPTDLAHYELPEWAFEAIKTVLVELRDDDRMEEWKGAPYRGIWATCGPGPVLPILERAELL